MKLTLAFPDQNRFIDTEVPDELTLAEFKSYIEAETGIAPASQILEHSKIHFDSQSLTLAQLGLKDHDDITLHVQKYSETSDPETQAIEQLRHQALANPQIRSQLAPEAAASLRDAGQFHTRMKEASFAARQKYMREMQELEQNQFLPENQKKLMDMIRRERIQKNLQLAYEITPEAFVNTTLLLIKLNINGHETHALVDSGAQKSVILAPVAESFGLHDLIDSQFAGMSRGVGQQQSPGRIHSVPVVLGDTNLALPCSFQVLEVGFPVLLGLDMLKTHRCIIDLSKNALVVGEFEIPFMPEHEVERLTNEAHRDSPPAPASATGTSGSARPLGGNLGGMNSGGHRLGGDVGSSQQNSQRAAQVPAAQAAAQAATQAATQSSTSQSSTSQPPAASVSEEKVQQLVSLGFSRTEALEALRVSNGNVEVAAAYLFQ